VAESQAGSHCRLPALRVASAAARVPWEREEREKRREEEQREERRGGEREEGEGEREERREEAEEAEVRVAEEAEEAEDRVAEQAEEAVVVEGGRGEVGDGGDEDGEREGEVAREQQRLRNISNSTVHTSKQDLELSTAF
jgi:hypothetical protein